MGTDETRAMKPSVKAGECGITRSSRDPQRSGGEDVATSHLVYNPTSPNTTSAPREQDRLIRRSSRRTSAPAGAPHTPQKTSHQRSTTYEEGRLCVPGVARSRLGAAGPHERHARHPHTRTLAAPLRLAHGPGAEDAPPYPRPLPILLVGLEVRAGCPGRLAAETQPTRSL